MFYIYSKNVASSANELQRVTRSWGSRIQDLYRVESALSEFSGMDNVMKQLRKSRDLLESQSQMLAMITQVTDKVAQRYSNAEGRIIDNGEGSISNRAYPGYEKSNLFETGSISSVKVININR